MHRVLVYAPTSATRKLYQKNLFSREREILVSKDAAEFFLALVTFEIDTLILVDEGKQHEWNMLLEIIHKKYDHKRCITITMNSRVIRGFERFSSTRAFFQSLQREERDRDEFID